MLTILLIVLAVILVLALVGGFGYRSRRY